MLQALVSGNFLSSNTGLLKPGTGACLLPFLYLLWPPVKTSDRDMHHNTHKYILLMFLHIALQHTFLRPAEVAVHPSHVLCAALIEM